MEKDYIKAKIFDLIKQQIKNLGLTNLCFLTQRESRSPEFFGISMKIWTEP